MNTYHETVLTNEVIEGLNVKKNGKYIDCTLGNAGHTIQILKLGGQVLGIDLDPEMLEIARQRIEDEKLSNYLFVNGNFKDLDKIAKQNGFSRVDGILLDLGVTNLHLKDLERGFSFENPDAILDMRIDKESQGVKVCDLLNALRRDQLEEMFKVTLDGGPARWLTERIVNFRKFNNFKTVGELLTICQDIKIGKSGLNKATLPFLALRIAVNGELENLQEVLPYAFNLLNVKGRMLVISFHSKEDEIVKDFLRSKREEGTGEVITYKPIKASESELNENRRARSARLRILEKI